MKTYRDRGAIGALLDEYEKAINELINEISPLSNDELLKIVDHETKDEDCRSVQSILNHVLRAGYYYCVVTRQHLGEEVTMKTFPLYNSTKEYSSALLEMFEYNNSMFEHIDNNQIEEKTTENKIHAQWGQTYDIEQMYEHAIVHILRHRRQIERFIRKLTLS